MSKEKIGAGKAAPVGKSKEIKDKQGTADQSPAGKAGNSHVDDSLRKLAGSIRDYAEAHKSSDSGWSKVKSAAEAVHNGVKLDISKLIRELAEINDTEAKGFSVELTLALEGKNTDALKAGHVIEIGKVQGKPDEQVSTSSPDTEAQAVPQKDKPAKPDPKKPKQLSAFNDDNIGFSCDIAPVRMESIETDPEAASMFDRNSYVYESIRQSMLKDGFISHLPIKVWAREDGKFIPYDGNTRIEIARTIKTIEWVTAVKTKFKTREEFLQAAVDEQLGRRNMSIKDKFTAVKYCYPGESEKANKRRGGTQSADESADLQSGRAAAIIGEKIGYGPDTVTRIWALIENDDSKLLERVFSSEISPTAAYKSMCAKKKKRDAGADKNTGQPQEPPAGNTGDAGKPERVAYGDKAVDTQATAEENAPQCEAQAQSGRSTSEQQQGLPDQQIAQPEPEQPTLKSSDNQCGDNTFVITGPQLANLITLIPDTDITVLLVDLDTWNPKTAGFIRQCLENGNAANRRLQSMKSPAEELTFRKGNSSQQQRKGNVKADTSTGIHK